MPDTPEFRVGDVSRDDAARGTAAPAAGSGLDAATFATLVAFLKGSPPEFRARLDELAAHARRETNPEVQTALQTAQRLLPDLYSRYGGEK